MNLSLSVKKSVARQNSETNRKSCVISEGAKQRNYVISRPESAKNESVRDERQLEAVCGVYNESEILLTCKEAMASPEGDKWKKAIEEEKESLNENETWVYANKEEVKDKEVLTSRWVFSVKSDGRYKARLVARGCQQKSENIDFKEVFSPVVETSSVRILLALGAQTDYKIHTFDVKTAFLYDTLDKEIYMKIPEGYDEQGTGKVCLLKKALYGLRQAPLRWNKRLTDFLRSEGLIQLKNDQCIFKTADNNLYLAIHVDDGLIVAKNSVVVKRLLDGLGKEL